MGKKLPIDLGLILEPKSRACGTISTTNPKATAQWFVDRLRGRIHGGALPSDRNEQFLWILEPQEGILPLKLSGNDYYRVQAALMQFASLDLVVRREHKVEDVVQAMCRDEGFTITHHGSDYYFVRAPDKLGRFYLRFLPSDGTTLIDPAFDVPEDKHPLLPSFDTKNENGCGGTQDPGDDDE